MSLSACYRESLHEHVSAVAIAELLLGLELPVLDVLAGVPALPAAGVVHVGAVLSDGVRAALRTAGVETLHRLARLAGGRQVQAVHPAVS